MESCSDPNSPTDHTIVTVSSADPSDDEKDTTPTHRFNGLSFASHHDLNRTARANQPGRFTSETFDDLSAIPSSPMELSTPSKFDSLSKSFTFGAQLAPPAFLDTIRSPVCDLNATYPADMSTRMRVSGARGLHKLCGRGLDTISFSPLPKTMLSSSRVGSVLSMYRDSPLSSPLNRSLNRSGPMNQSLNKSGLQDMDRDWNLHALLDGDTRMAAMALGPTKALITMDGHGDILVANRLACELFGYKSAEITRKNLDDLVSEGKGKALSKLLMHEEHGKQETVNGRVVEASNKEGLDFTVSLWMTKLAPNAEAKGVRYVAVMEPVTRETVQFALNTLNAIVWCNTRFLQSFRLSHHQALAMNVEDLIPNLKETLKRTPGESSPVPMHVTTRGVDATSIPATLTLTIPTESERKILADDGVAPQIISTISKMATLHVYHNISGLVTCDECGVITGCNETFVALLFGYTVEQLVGQNISVILPNVVSEDLSGLPSASSSSSSSPVQGLDGDGNDVVNERYCEGMHKDGSTFDVLFSVKNVVDNNFKMYTCLWISREEAETQFDTSTISDCNSTATLQAKEHQELLADDQLNLDQRLTVGDFEKHYTVEGKLGTGAFGSVVKGRSLTSNQPVVVKFIVKSKVLDECWDPIPQDIWAKKLCHDKGEIPREINVLMRLRHKNIVSAFEVFENTEVYQLVLGYDGAVFDLFRYIDETPRVKEEVASHILRQITAAVEYLHTKHIIHRDIKDENIILDVDLNAKLIDFGSAHYAEKGKLFHTFCGTFEYCAPEVLLGNPYPGPELDMFALGVTLFTLIFGERPFFDVEETIAGLLYAPFGVSSLCTEVVLWILDPDPTKRATASKLVEHKWLTQDVHAVVRMNSLMCATPTTSPLKTMRRASSVSNSSNHDHDLSDDDDDDDDDESNGIKFDYDKLIES